MKRLLLLPVLMILVATSQAREPIRLANHPALSPDGKLLAFDHLGDIWVVPSTGGTARPLTQNTARDGYPKFSPDGKEIAFVSDRDGNPQVYVMPATGGTPRQITFHTSGFALHEWTPDGNEVLVSAMRDHAWSRRTPERFYLVNVRKRMAEQLLFDDYGTGGTLSPDGKKLLFTREGPEWWRKGYTGSASSQIWCYDLESKKFESILMDNNDHRWPMWMPDGKGMYFCSNTKNGFILKQMPLNGNGSPSSREGTVARTVASFADDSIVFPCIARDGGTIVFRHLFDFYRLEKGSSNPVKIEIARDDDRPVERIDRRTLDRANAVSFTDNGLEIAIIAGGDLWVMDTELREPKRVTKTAEEERTPLFTPDGQGLLFVSDAGGQTDIWKATRVDPKKPWWLNNNFKLEKVTTDGAVNSDLSFSPDGSKLAYVSGRGNLVIADANGKNPKTFIESWNAPGYDWSPDGKWMVYSLYDNDFNSDIWIKPLDGSRQPFNLSRHPYNERDPVWSPDGKVIAFVGAREEKDKFDIHFVYLRAEDHERNARDRSIEKALDKMKGKSGPTKGGGFGPKTGDEAQEPEKGPEPRIKGETKPEEKKDPAKKNVEVIIDFDGIHDRIRRVSIANSNESNLLWSPDSKRLAFTAMIGGTPATYTIEPPENLTPTQLSTQTGSQSRWLRSGQIVWLSNGIPASISGTAGPAAAAPTTPTTPAPKGGGFGGRFGGGGGGGGAATPGGYRFTAYQDLDPAKKYQAAFDMCWRVMRDNWYDAKVGNRDWNAVRAKYLPMAETTDAETLQTVVQMMLGELNGSHLGFTMGAGGPPGRGRGTPTPPDDPATADRSWRLVTAHLGVRFDESHKGQGIKVRDVLPDGPADHKKSKLNAGDIIVSIDGATVDSSMDLTTVLNGQAQRDIVLKVKDAGGKEREVIIRPLSPVAARTLVYRKWLKDNQAMVDKLSNGTLGYLHVRAMDALSFNEFQEELFNAGAGKDGLVIDVRENGGGSTADLLLTALTQPRHAIAVPRGGGQGYPQDRTIFATWNKPIIVLCNQNSFSNAEIFSHAIKTLKRGQLVGVATAGGVISTGATGIMDVGTLRLPFRGWYVIEDGEDMELHGAVPHHIVWPAPGDAAQGKDAQIAKAVDVLLKDVKDWKARPQPKLKSATDR